MVRKLNWQAFTSVSRIEAIDHIKEVINLNGGAILHFNMFSDLALSLIIEVNENDIMKMHTALRSTVNISEKMPEDISEDSNSSWTIFMNVSFGNEKGNLKSSIPTVPG